jgi:hypothetical protein
LILNNYCAGGRTSKNRLREWYADEPALQEQLKLDPAEVEQRFSEEFDIKDLEPLPPGLAIDAVYLMKRKGVEP